MPSDDYDLENINYFGWPLGASLLLGELPLPATGGLRLSFTGEKPTHEVWLGTSLSWFSVEDLSLSMVG